ncbi:MAG: hypothetical protein GXO69_10000, partial [Acidobacteria bacterium]|nr:hypothetical protein [Acidobacteriota bacterium]
MADEKKAKTPAEQVNDLEKEVKQAEVKKPAAAPKTEKPAGAKPKPAG